MNINKIILVFSLSLLEHGLSGLIQKSIHESPIHNLEDLMKIKQPIQDTLKHKLDGPKNFINLDNFQHEMGWLDGDSHL